MFTVGIIISSDKGYIGKMEDKSGQVIEEIVSQNGFKVIKKIVLPDEKELLEKEIEQEIQALEETEKKIEAIQEKRKAHEGR